MEPTVITGKVTVTPGSVIEGRYKRANRDSKVVKLGVDKCLLVPDRFGTPVPYIAGTRLDGAQSGMVMALRADCFNPNEVAVTADPEYVALEDGYYINPGNDPMFGFLEHIDNEVDVELALERGGKPVQEFDCGSHDLPANLILEVVEEEATLEEVVEALDIDVEA